MEVLKTRVRIDSPELVEALIKSQNEALQLLSKYAPVTVDDLDIDRQGRLVISDQKFVQAVQDEQNSPGMMASSKNSVCGLGC
jgi:hypothetical protein